MERCYEYFDCQKKDCVMYTITDDKQCWEIDGTQCNFPGIERLRKKHSNKVDVCKACLYYQKSETKNC
jgi:hypothetical protein